MFVRLPHTLVGLFLLVLMSAQPAAATIIGGIYSTDDVLQRVSPSVVAIGNDDNGQFKQRGTGVVIDASLGHVLTGFRGDLGSQPQVHLHNNETVPAEIVGSDQIGGLMLLRINQPGLVALVDAATPGQAGDFVIAVGSVTKPSDVAPVAPGILMTASDLGEMIVTTAALSPLSAGGPLVNFRGEILGITATAANIAAGGCQGSRAIPIDFARKVALQLVTYGQVQRGRIGIHIQAVTPSLALALNCSPEQPGAVVAHVMPGSAGAKMGLQAGDIITQFNDHPVRDHNQLKTLVAHEFGGVPIRLGILRNGVTQTLQGRISASGTPTKTIDRLGQVQLGTVDSKHSAYAYLEGVTLNDIAAESPAYLAGLRDGDVIFAVNYQPIVDATSLAQKLAIQAGHPATLSIRRQRQVLLIALP